MAVGRIEQRRQTSPGRIQRAGPGGLLFGGNQEPVDFSKIRMTGFSRPEAPLARVAESARLPMTRQAAGAVQKASEFLFPGAEGAGIVTVKGPFSGREVGIDPLGIAGFARRVGVNLGKRGLEKVAASKSSEEIFSLLKRSSTEVPEQTLRELSEDLVRVSVPKQVEETIGKKLSGLAKRAPETVKTRESFAPIRSIGETKVRVPTEKTAFTGAKTLAGKVGGREFVTDSFILEFDKGSILGRTSESATEAVSKVVDDFIKKLSTWKTVAVPKEAGFVYSRPVAILKLGSDEIPVDAEKYNYLAKKFKDISFKTEGPARPIAFFSGDDLKGFLMPLADTKALQRRTSLAGAKEVVPIAGQSPIPSPRPAVSPRKPEVSSEAKPTPTKVEKPRTEGKPPTPEEISESRKQVYTAGAGKARKFDKALKESGVATNEPALFQRVSEGLKKAKTKIIEYVQNADERVRLLVGNAKNITDSSNPYLRATLMPGRLDVLVREGKEVAEKVFNSMADYAKTQKVEFKALRQEVNDYLWLRHAPERNAAIGEGAAGITTKEAAERMARLETSPRFAKIKEYAEELSNLNTKTLDMLRNGGVITDELYNILRTKYKNHVPLNRVFEYTDDVGEALSGRGFDVRSTGIKTAKGSEREIEDIVENIIVNYEQAAIRSEKNIVDLATLKFVKDNPSDLFKIIKPKAIGKTLGEEQRIILQRTDDPQVLQMFEGGKRIWVEIKDPNLAIALRGVGREKLGSMMSWVGAFTRFYSGLATRFNPEFALSNKIRDLQEVMVYMSAQEGVGVSGALKTVAADPASGKGVLDALRGVDTEGARLYNEMRRLGGTTGGMGLSTRQQVELNIKALEKLATSNPRKYAERLLRYIDNWNTIFEDSTRLSVYKASLDKGFSKDQAAFFAKEASVNFNRMGQGGPLINAIWMFSNASLQGSMKMIRSLKNPKVLVGTTAVVGGAVAAVNQWNDRVDPNWRNSVSKWDRLNSLPIMIPSDDGTVRNFAIPIGWGIKPIKVMADYAYDTLSGQKPGVKNAVEDLLTSIIDSYNPIGGSDLLSAATPTILDVPLELGRNLKWSGSKIKPDIDPYAPESIKYFDSLAEKGTGKTAISLTQNLAGYGVEISPADVTYAFEQYVGGAGRTVERFVNTVWGAATGKLPPISEFPFVARFYREREEDEIFNTEANEAVRNLMGEDRKEKFYLRRRAEQEWDSIAELSSEEKKEKLRTIAKESPELAEKVLDVGEAGRLGLSGVERQLKTAPVSVRAQHISNQIKGLPREEKKKILLDYAKKKILTDATLDEMVKLTPEQK